MATTYIRLISIRRKCKHFWATKRFVHLNTSTFVSITRRIASMQLKHASDVMKSQECKVGQRLLAEPDSTTLEHADEVNDSLHQQDKPHVDTLVQMSLPLTTKTRLQHASDKAWRGLVIMHMIKLSRSSNTKNWSSCVSSPPIIKTLSTGPHTHS